MLWGYGYGVVRGNWRVDWNVESHPKAIAFDIPGQHTQLERWPFVSQPTWRRIPSNTDTPSSQSLVLFLLIPKDPAPCWVSSFSFPSSMGPFCFQDLWFLMCNYLFSCPVSSHYLQEPWVHRCHPIYMSVPQSEEFQNQGLPNEVSKLGTGKLSKWPDNKYFQPCRPYGFLQHLSSAMPERKSLKVICKWISRTLSP